MNTIFALNYRQPFFLAVLFHLIFLAVILFQLNASTDAPAAPPATQEIIQATLVNLPLPTQATDAPVPREQPAELMQKIERPAPTVPKPRVESKIEPTHSEELVLEKAATQKLAEDALAFEKMKQQAQAKKRAEKAKAVEKQLQAAIAAQVEKEQAQTKVQSQLKQQKTIEQLLQQDLAKSLSPQSHVKSISTAKSASHIDNKEIDHYKSLVIAAISRRWIMPENLKKGLECHLKVRLAPGGMVLGVTLIRSSGESALDHSAESAIYTASPLPVPKEANLFGEFREFNLVVRPEGILVG